MSPTRLTRFVARHASSNLAIVITDLDTAKSMAEIGFGF